MEGMTIIIWLAVVFNLLWFAHLAMRVLEYRMSKPLHEAAALGWTQITMREKYNREISESVPMYVRKAIEARVGKDKALDMFGDELKKPDA